MKGNGRGRSIVVWKSFKGEGRYVGEDEWRYSKGLKE